MDSTCERSNPWHPFAKQTLDDSLTGGFGIGLPCRVPSLQSGSPRSLRCFCVPLGRAEEPSTMRLDTGGVDQA